jgi:hypothetical protein
MEGVPRRPLVVSVEAQGQSAKVSATVGDDVVGLRLSGR